MADAVNEFFFDAFEGEIMLVADDDADIDIDVDVEGDLDGLEGNGDEAVSVYSVTPDNSDDDAEEEDGDEASEAEDPVLVANGADGLNCMRVTVVHDTLEKKRVNHHELNGPVSKVFVAQTVEDGFYEQWFEEIDGAANALRLHGSPIGPAQQRRGTHVLALNKDRFGRAKITAVQHHAALCYFIDVGCRKPVPIDDIYAMPDELRLLRERVIPVWVNGAIHKDDKIRIKIIAFENGIPIAKQIQPNQAQAHPINNAL